MKEMSCPLCHEKIYSSIGKGCLMYGMPLNDEGREFCSKTCRKGYKTINHNRLQIT